MVFRGDGLVLVNAGDIKLECLAAPVPDKAIASPLAEHVYLLVGFTAAGRLALIARQRTVRRIVPNVLRVLAVIYQIFRPG